MGCALAPRPLLLLLVVVVAVVLLLLLAALAGVSLVVLGTSSSSSSSILCAARDANRKASKRKQSSALHPSFGCTHLASPLATTTSTTLFARSSCRAARSEATRRTMLSRLSPSESLGSDRGDAPACDFSSVLRRRCRRSTNTSDARRRSRAPARRCRRRVDGTRSPRAAFESHVVSMLPSSSSLPPHVRSTHPTVL